MTQKLNYHKVLFTLQTLNSSEEKISYLYTVKVDINRIIKCFSGQKFQALKKYAKKNIFAEDGCEELTEFLKEVITYYNSPQYGDRYISDAVLKRHIREEIIKYKNFLKIIDSEIEFWVSQRERVGTHSKTKKDANMDEIRNESKEIEESELDGIDNSTSIRELREKLVQKIMWHGSKEDLIRFFDQLFNQQLLNIKSYDEIFAIASHYFIDADENPIIVKKSDSAKMNLNGPRIPDGYQRYMKTIEKLKSNK